MKRNIINRMTRKPEKEGYSRGMYRTHIQLDQYELNDRLKMTKKKEVSLFFVTSTFFLQHTSKTSKQLLFESQYNTENSETFNKLDFERFDNLIYLFYFWII